MAAQWRLELRQVAYLTVTAAALILIIAFPTVTRAILLDGPTKAKYTSRGNGPVPALAVSRLETVSGVHRAVATSSIIPQRVSKGSRIVRPGNAYVYSNQHIGSGPHADALRLEGSRSLGRGEVALDWALARLLGANPGDTVEVEYLFGGSEIVTFGGALRVASVYQSTGALKMSVAMTAPTFDDIAAGKRNIAQVGYSDLWVTSRNAVGVARAIDSDLLQGESLQWTPRYVEIAAAEAELERSMPRVWRNVLYSLFGIVAAAVVSREHRHRLTSAQADDGLLMMFGLTPRHIALVRAGEFFAATLLAVLIANLAAAVVLERQVRVFVSPATREQFVMGSLAAAVVIGATRWFVLKRRYSRANVADFVRGEDGQ